MASSNYGTHDVRLWIAQTEKLLEEDPSGSGVHIQTEWFGNMGVDGF